MTLMAVSSQSEKAAHVLYAEAEHRSEGTSAAALADFSTCRPKAQQGAACAERLATWLHLRCGGQCFCIRLMMVQHGTNNQFQSGMAECNYKKEPSGLVVRVSSVLGFGAKVAGFGV